MITQRKIGRQFVVNRQASAGLQLDVARLIELKAGARRLTRHGWMLPRIGRVHAHGPVDGRKVAADVMRRVPTRRRSHHQLPKRQSAFVIGPPEVLCIRVAGVSACLGCRQNPALLPNWLNSSGL